MTGQDVKVDILVEYRRTGTEGNGGDKAIHQLANGFAVSAAGAVQSRGIIVVCGFRGKHGCKCEQTAERVQVPLVPRSSEHLHPNRVADRDLSFE